MKKLSIFALGVVFGIMATGFAVVTLNPLSNQLVQSVLWFQRADEQKALFYQGFNIAKQVVSQAKNQQHAKPLAVIVDIDETMLDNSPFEAMLVKTGQTFNGKLWHQWVKMEAASALPGAVEFTKFAKANGVEVFYISNRREENFSYTLENLKKLGFEYADRKHLLLKTLTSDKTERINKILNNYDVICYIGDNLGDFNQKYVKNSPNYNPQNVTQDKDLFGTLYIVMPNPMYGAWDIRHYPDTIKTNMQKAQYKINLLNNKGYEALQR